MTEFKMGNSMMYVTGIYNFLYYKSMVCVDAPDFESRESAISTLTSWGLDKVKSVPVCPTPESIGMDIYHYHDLSGENCPCYKIDKYK